MSLQTQAMLVVLSVSGWGARKQDKKVAAEVEASHNAHDAGEYRKRLIDIWSHWRDSKARCASTTTR